jgi:hypothetical protein
MEKTFHMAWFSYIRLVEFGNEMQCFRCGETPAVTIWDGVTLSFNRKNILAILRPPTMIDKQSKVKTGIKPQHGLQLIADKHLRKIIQTVLNGKHSLYQSYQTNPMGHLCPVLRPRR